MTNNRQLVGGLRRAPWPAVLAATVLVSACIFVLEAPLGVNVANNTTTPIDVFYPSDGPTQGHLEPAASRIFTFGLKPGVPGQDCTTADIVARRADGTEFARIPPPICIHRNVNLSEWLKP